MTFHKPDVWRDKVLEVRDVEHAVPSDNRDVLIEHIRKWRRGLAELPEVPLSDRSGCRGGAGWPLRALDRRVLRSRCQSSLVYGRRSLLIDLLGHSISDRPIDAT
jgi:hypothetical protein